MDKKKKEQSVQEIQQRPTESSEGGLGEVAIYNPDKSIRLEVRLEQETVWLTQSQMGILFGVDRTVIVRHIGNIYMSGELEEPATCAKITQVHNEGERLVSRAQKFYNLDMILSVGYRVNSRYATYFRKWASNVLKDYLLKGYSINPRLEQLERRVAKTEERIDFFVKTALPPVEGLFFDGQIFDAYDFICKLIKAATKRIILIDNYIDESVLTIIDKRAIGVLATIYTQTISKQLALDVTKHDAQYPPIPIYTFTKSHDRFLIIDQRVYHLGASIKDLGKKWFAVMEMAGEDPDDLMSRL